MEERCSVAPVLISPQNGRQVVQYLTKPPSQKTRLLRCITLSRTNCFFAILHTVRETNPGIPNKLLLLKVDRYTHNECNGHSETHQASRNPIRRKTNIWSCKLSLHHHPSRPTLQSETLLDGWTNKSKHFKRLSFGGQISNHISLLLFYVWAGGRRWGVGGGGVHMKEGERGWWAFTENIIGMAPVTLSVRLCCASLCALTGPLRCFIKQGAGPLRRCLCSLCGSTTQRGARLRWRCYN